MYKFISKNWGLLVVLLFSIIPLLPLFHTGFFPMHDDTQVARVFEMGNALKDEMVPARWSQDLGFGYGYPLFTFYAPLAFYAGGVLTLGGISALLATKIMMGIGIVLSGVFMYYLARSVWGEMGGVAAGLFYLYAPYHALDIYVRGDVAEFWAYAFIPLAFLGFWKAAQAKKLRYTLLGALGFAGIILSHNLTAVMVTPFLFAFGIALIFLSQKKLSTFYYLLSTFLLGLGFAAFYFLPVPFEMQYTNVASQVTGGADFHKNFVCISQLWNSPWGYGGSIPGCIDGISFALGKIYVLYFVLGVFAIPLIWIKNKQKGLVALGGLLGVALSLFLLLQVSQPIWNAIHFMAFFQYPWRFFILVFFFLSFASGGIFWLIEQHKLLKKYIVSFFVLLLTSVILLTIQGKYFTPQLYERVTSDVYTNRTALEWVTSNITSEYMPQTFHKPTYQNQIVTKRFALSPSVGKILATTEKTQEKTAKVMVRSPGKLLVSLAYFPGWTAFIDGEKTPIMVIPTGMALIIPQGQHTIGIVYTSTFIELIGNGVTLLSIAIVILVIIGRCTYEKAKR